MQPRKRQPLRPRILSALLLGGLLLLGAAGPTAALDLQVDPLVPAVEVDASGHLSIMLSDPVDVKLVELWMEFDPTIVRHLQGGAGELFTDGPACEPVVVSNIPEPGIWHIYVVLPDAGCHTTGAGELVWWNFLGLDEGESQFRCIDASVYDAAGDPIPDVTLPPTAIHVSTLSHIELIAAPAYQVRGLTDTGHISISLVDSLEVRSIELWVDYDPAVVQHDSTNPGELFLEHPCYIWEEFELLYPGRWHGFAVLIGHECWIERPGELVRWNFTAVGEGISPVTGVRVDLYDREGLPYEDVSLTGAEIQVYPSSAYILESLPETQTLQVQEQGTISVVLNDTLDIRSVELWMEYDPLVVDHFSGGPGELFRLLPCITWTDFELIEPGLWHGFAVIIGHDCWTTGPGEVMYWNFTGRSEGVSPVISVSADLYGVNGLPLPNVVQTPAEIVINDPYAPVQETPPATTALRLHPNPFNPRTTVTLPSGGGENARLDVYDALGRRVKQLWHGELKPATAAAIWDGTDDKGRNVPSGMYIFRLESESGATSLALGTLLR